MRIIPTVLSLSYLIFPNYRLIFILNNHIRVSSSSSEVVKIKKSSKMITCYCAFKLIFYWGKGPFHSKSAAIILHNNQILRTGASSANAMLNFPKTSQSNDKSNNCGCSSGKRNTFFFPGPIKVIQIATFKGVKLSAESVRGWWGSVVIETRGSEPIV